MVGRAVGQGAVGGRGETGLGKNRRGNAVRGRDAATIIDGASDFERRM